MELLGLMLNFFGTLIIWRYGFPANIGRDGDVKITGLWHEGPQPEEFLKMRRRILFGKWASNLGVFCIAVGFLIQAWPYLQGVMTR